MPKAMLGTKIGMTRMFAERERFIPSGGMVKTVVNDPITIIKLGPCFVSQIKTEETDGYNAVQFAYEDVKGRNSTMPVIGHDAKAGLTPKRHHAESRLEASELDGYELGQELNVEWFSEVLFVDVTGISKGKGCAGGMKRWGFKGLSASHGTERKHRSAGSVGGRSSNAGTGRPKKGGHKAGHMGSKQITVRSLEVLGIDKEKGLLLVLGPVPGTRKGVVYIREAKRLYKRKAARAAAAS